MLKRYLFLLLLMLSFPQFMNAEEIEKPITKGNVALGGSGYIRYDDGLGFGLSPSAGYFFCDGLLLGVDPRIGIWFENGYTLTILGISPFAKYYFENGFFLGLEAGYSYGRTSDSEELRSKENSFTISPRIGYAIFINSKVSLEPALVYSKHYSKRTYKDGSSKGKGSELFVTIGFNIFL